MENNLINDKSMKESLYIKNKDLLEEINKLKQENTKLIMENNNLNNKLSTTEQLLLEVREQKELILKEKEEAERRHQETIEQLRKEADENEQRFILQMNKMDAQTVKIVNSVKNSVKSNTNGSINRPQENNQREVLRLFINRSDLSNEDIINIKINRCQLKYLKPLKFEELQLGNLLNTPNAISTLNKFIETSSIEIVRLSSNKLQIDIDQLELFQSEFKKFVIESQQLKEIEIIPEEVNNEVNYNLLKYENLINNLYHAKRGAVALQRYHLEGSYRSLQYNQQTNSLYYTIKSTNRVVQITNIQNLLQGKLVKINGTTKKRINTIRLINDKYEVTYRD